MNINDAQLDQTITLKDAYKLLEAFIVQYNARGESSTVELLANIGLCPDGYAGDPAQISDFLQTYYMLFGTLEQRPSK